jgi:glutathione S-transferase
MITLHSFGPKVKVADPSAFVLKVETYMRMAGIPFKAKANVNNLRVAPKGKLPFITSNQNLIADSYFIIEHLKSENGDVLDAWLTPEQKAIAHLISKSLDENLYWCIVHSRWMSDDVWPILKNAFFSDLPFPVKHIIPKVARKSVEKNLHGHGMGRHTDQEVFQIAEHSLQSLADLLADKEYFFGDRISSLDVSVFAHLAQVVLVDIKHPINARAQEFENLVAFCLRMQSSNFVGDSQ